MQLVQKPNKLLVRYGPGGPTGATTMNAEMPTHKSIQTSYERALSVRLELKLTVRVESPNPPVKWLTYCSVLVWRLLTGAASFLFFNEGLL